MDEMIGYTDEFSLARFRKLRNLESQFGKFEEQFRMVRVNDESILRSIVEGTAAETGEGFFKALVKNLAHALNVHGSWVTEYLEDAGRLKAFAFWLGNTWVADYEYAIEGTPCGEVVKHSHLVHIPDNVIELYPKDPDLREQQAVSYLGVPLQDVDGKVLGHLAVLDKKTLWKDQRILEIFQIFQARAAAELRRMRAEADLRYREEKLKSLVSNAMDGIVELDSAMQIIFTNQAAEKSFHCKSEELLGLNFSKFLSTESSGKLRMLIDDLQRRLKSERSLWISGGLNVVRKDGSTFPAEATLSSYEVRRVPFYTLILRNVNERREAERRIQTLSQEAEYLREEIRSIQNFDEIVGQSSAILSVLREIREVAETDATVLILGDSGTGKELVARAIHGLSRRKEHPMIKVNCAAIPSSLMESEFFGHEKGAFTGATIKREGRFALADKGTIFLDEIGEMPLELQVKLLRVIQEGEIEAVGSSITKKIDVRIIAATNRDLRQAIKDGKFREDLYYRLNVFPIRVPRLSERIEDIELLATKFAEKFAARMGRKIEPLSIECISRLQKYDWPGNVRELQNVIERAVITSRDGRLNLERAFPEAEETGFIRSNEPFPKNVLTANDLQQIERENMLQALHQTNWKVSGKDGAACLLGINPSTFVSRMKVLGIKRNS
jgi:PAS domain S-box-containing protein